MATTSPSPSCDVEKKKIPNSGGVCVGGGALIGYGALQELLNNGGVHSQSLWKKKKSNALIFHSSLVSSPSPFGSASNVNVSHSERALARTLRREILF